MPDATLWQCVEATGVCEGLRVTADRGIVTVGPGLGYAGGQAVRGDWRIDLGEQCGWRFVQVAPGGGFAHAQEVEGALPLALVRVERGAVVAIRCVRPRLYMWRWLGPVGAILHHVAGREVVTRVQGAVQRGGYWETARAFVPWSIGEVLEPGAVVSAEVRWDKPALAATGVVLETVGIVQ